MILAPVDGACAQVVNGGWIVMDKVDEPGGVA